MKENFPTVLLLLQKHNVQIFLAVHSHLLTLTTFEHGRSCTTTTAAKAAFCMKTPPKMRTYCLSKVKLKELFVSVVHVTDDRLQEERHFRVWAVSSVSTLGPHSAQD